MENGQSVFFLSPHTPVGRVRLARFARVRLLRHALPISFTDFEKKIDCFAVYRRSCFDHIRNDNCPNDSRRIMPFVASVPFWFLAGKYALEDSSIVCRVPF